MMTNGGACSTLSLDPLGCSTTGRVLSLDSAAGYCAAHTPSPTWPEDATPITVDGKGLATMYTRPHSAPPITEPRAPPKPAANTWGAGHRRLARSGHRRWRSGGHPTAGGSHRRWSQVDLGACGGHLRLASASRSWIGFTVPSTYGWSATRCAVLKLRRPSLGWLTPRM